MEEKTAIIIGAGPAGLTVAYELLKKTDIKPIIFEATNDIGGISKTVNYKGNRIDIGGHRFFSKSEKVVEWWLNIMPLQSKGGKSPLNDAAKPAPTQEVGIEKANAEEIDDVMLIRHRMSRIFFLRKFFDYPISLSKNTFFNLGLWRMIRIFFSYLKSVIFPIKKEKSLEDFFINRFGKELYLIFFKDYTEKVWGIPCKKIQPEWGAQRIKGLSITKTLIHAVRKLFSTKPLSQTGVETTLIEQFMYPKKGPGQLWEKVAKLIEQKGGKIYKNHEVVGLKHNGSQIAEVCVRDQIKNAIKIQKGDYFFSTMPVKDLINGLDTPPNKVLQVAQGLMYRDFMTVGLLLSKLKLKNDTQIKTTGDLVPDNWIYIQERDVRIGRLQIFNNWSPYMVKDENTVWIGLEYFCNEGDDLWNKSDEDFIKFAIEELAKIDIISKEDVLDYTLIRMPKAYPAYFSTYDQFYLIREFLDQFENLFLIGRNGMHKYNNTDHSMLSAMTAVENIINGIKSKENIWKVNTEQEYQESK